MKSSFFVDIINAFSNSDISKMSIRYKKMSIDLEKNVNNSEIKKTNEKEINSPIVGTISKMMVSKGDKIKNGDTICIIEAMKTFNEIKSEGEYEVLDTFVKTNDAVECNQKIVLLRNLYD